MRTIELLDALSLLVFRRSVTGPGHLLWERMSRALSHRSELTHFLNMLKKMR